MVTNVVNCISTGKKGFLKHPFIVSKWFESEHRQFNDFRDSGLQVAKLPDQRYRIHHPRKYSTYFQTATILNLDKKDNFAQVLVLPGQIYRAG